MTDGRGRFRLRRLMLGHDIAVSVTKPGPADADPKRDAEADRNRRGRAVHAAAGARTAATAVRPGERRRLERAERRPHARSPGHRRDQRRGSARVLCAPATSCCSPSSTPMAQTPSWFPSSSSLTARVSSSTGCACRRLRPAGRRRGGRPLSPGGKRLSQGDDVAEEAERLQEAASRTALPAPAGAGDDAGRALPPRR